MSLGTAIAADRTGRLRHWGRMAARLVVQQPLGCLGMLVILAMVVASIAAPKIAPHDPLDVDFASMMTPPSPDHLLGTDSFGRDILSRIIYGTRTALIIRFVSSFLGCSLGAIVGISSAYASAPWWKARPSSRSARRPPSSPPERVVRSLR